MVVEAESSWALIHSPDFRFRPAHADTFHIDLWYRGRNLLRDGGSFSYCCEPAIYDYFRGTASHNTVEFDQRDQMPALGHFLFGAWVRTKTNQSLQADGATRSWEGVYTDFMGCRHQRRVEVRGRCWRITDEISGFRRCAKVRWRLLPDDWRATDDGCDGPLASLEIQVRGCASSVSLVEGWESRYYLERTRVPVLEAELKGGTQATVTTEITLK